MTDIVQTRVIVTGRVQGVCFRARTKQAADGLGVKGFVRNLKDRSVEAVFKGSEEMVAQMIEWCRKGPAAARVEDVQVEQTSAIADFDTFDIRY